MREIVNPRRVLVLFVLATAMTGCSSSDDTSAPDTQPDTVATSTTNTTTTTVLKRAPGWSPVAKPAAAGTADTSWFRSKSGQYVGVALPDRPKPFPVVVFFHGAAGLFSPTVDWMPKLARAGYAVVAGCWNAGSPDEGSVPCATVTNELAAARAMYNFAATIPGVDPERIAMMGISAGVELAVVEPSTSVRAIVADSGSTPELPDLHAPILVLGSKKDPRIPRIQKWASDLRRAGETVQTHIFENGDHVVTQHQETGLPATADVIRFLDAHMKAAA